MSRHSDSRASGSDMKAGAQTADSRCCVIEGSDGAVISRE